MKTRIRVIFTCGILVIILPFTGFPDSWKTIFSVIIGVIVCYATYLVHMQVSGKSTKIGRQKKMAMAADTFTQNTVVNSMTGDHNEVQQAENQA